MPRKWFKVTEKGSLLEFGYSPKKSTDSRRRALSEAVNSPKHSGYEVYHKLDGLAKVTEKTQPSNSKIYHSDAEWVKDAYMGTSKW